MRKTIQTVRSLIPIALGAGIFCVSILQPTLATAATYFVATNGSDSNPGTQSQPFRTIRAGLIVTRAGDTLYLRGGTYADSINSNSQTIPTGTSWTNAPRIAAYTNENVVLQGSYGNGINLAASYIQYVIIDGLIINGGGVSVQNGAHHIRIQNGEITNALGNGFSGGFSSTTTHHVELLNMKVHHNGGPEVAPGQGGRYDHGVYAAIQYMLIDGCDIYENTGYGIHIYDSGGGNSSNTVVRNTRVHNNHSQGGVILSYGSNIQFYNNVVYNNAISGVIANYDAINPGIYNNTIYNHPNGYGIEVGSSVAGAVIRNNILYQNAASIVNYNSITASNNLTSDPKFVNAGNGDFALQSSSPAIDTGATITLVATDFFGTPRPSGGAYDIGAVEFSNAAPLPTAPQNVRIVSQ